MAIREKEGNFPINRAALCLTGLLVSYCITLIALLIFSFFLYKLRLGDGVMKAGVMVIYILATLAGGFFMGKKVIQRKYVWGLLMGALYFLILWGVSLCIPQSQGDIGINTFVALLMCLAGGMLGGMVS